MAVADKLNKLISDIGDAYDAVDSKGGTIPANKNTDNLADAINSISGKSTTYKLLTSYTLASDTQNFTIPASAEAKECTNFVMKITCSLSANDWIYVGLNTPVTYYNRKASSFDFVCGLGIIEGITFQDGKKLNRIYKTGGTGMAVSNDSSISQLSSFAFKTYTTSVNILAGMTIEVYGL